MFSRWKISYIHRDTHVLVWNIVDWFLVVSQIFFKKNWSSATARFVQFSRLVYISILMLRYICTAGTTHSDHCALNCFFFSKAFIIYKPQRHACLPSSLQVFIFRFTRLPAHPAEMATTPCGSLTCHRWYKREQWRDIYFSLWDLVGGGRERGRHSRPSVWMISCKAIPNIKEKKQKNK